MTEDERVDQNRPRPSRRQGVSNASTYDTLRRKWFLKEITTSEFANVLLQRDLAGSHHVILNQKQRTGFWDGRASRLDM